MQRLGTVARGKTLKTSPLPAPTVHTSGGDSFSGKNSRIGWQDGEAKFVHTHSGIFDPFTSIPDKSLLTIILKLEERRMRTE